MDINKHRYQSGYRISQFVLNVGGSIQEYPCNFTIFLLNDLFERRFIEWKFIRFKDI